MSEGTRNLIRNGIRRILRRKGYKDNGTFRVVFQRDGCVYAYWWDELKGIQYQQKELLCTGCFGIDMKVGKPYSLEEMGINPERSR
jgi:hypothetical protein